MSFLLGLFGLLSMIVGAFLCFGLMARDLIGIGGAVLFTGGWLMMGLSAILEKQSGLMKLIREIAERKPEPPTPIVSEEASQRLTARHAGRTSNQAPA